MALRKRHRGWFLGAWPVVGLLAVMLLALACAPFAPSPDLEAYHKLARNKDAMVRAEVLAPDHFDKSRIFYIKARSACEDESRRACDRYAALARENLARAMEQARWLDPGPGSAVLATRSAQPEQLEDSRDEHLDRIMYLEELAHRSKIAKHRAMIATILARERRAVSKIEAVVQAKRQLVQQQQQQRQTQERMEAEARLEQETRSLFDEAQRAFGRGSVRRGPEGVVILFRGLFRPARRELDAKRSRSLEGVVRLARDHQHYRIAVEGHTDDRGRETDNVRRSLARAQAVKAYLVTAGISDERIITVGHGEARPVASNGKLWGRAANRRIEIIFVP